MNAPRESPGMIPEKIFEPGAGLRLNYGR